MPDMPCSICTKILALQIRKSDLIKVFDLITSQDLPGILSTSVIVNPISKQVVRNEQIRGVFSTLVDPNSIC